MKSWSFKSPTEICHISAVLDETVQELQDRQKLPKVRTSCHKIACCDALSSCSLQAALIEGRNIQQHAVLGVLLYQQCIGLYGGGNSSVQMLDHIL
jgi:regulator of RNase E activity RraB